MSKRCTLSEKKKNHCLIKGMIKSVLQCEVTHVLLYIHRCLTGYARRPFLCDVFHSCRIKKKKKKIDTVINGN